MSSLSQCFQSFWGVAHQRMLWHTILLLLWNYSIAFLLSVSRLSHIEKASLTTGLSYFWHQIYNQCITYCKFAMFKQNYFIQHWCVLLKVRCYMSLPFMSLPFIMLLYNLMTQEAPTWVNSLAAVRLSTQDRCWVLMNAVCPHSKCFLLLLQQVLSLTC